jgi:hypothetical protein
MFLNNLFRQQWKQMLYQKVAQYIAICLGYFITPQSVPIRKSITQFGHHDSEFYEKP